MPTVKIIGGHGHIGLRLARELGRRPGYKVVSFVRQPAHEAEVSSTGAIPVLFDIETASMADMTAKLAGADYVVWTAGAGGKGGPERTYAVDRDAAVRAMQATRQVGGVSRFVMVSYLGSDKAPAMPQSNPLYHYGQAKHAADEYLRTQSGLDWTILNPGLLNHDEPTGRVDFNVTVADGNSRSISRSNVALIVATILTDDAVAKCTQYKEIPCLDGTTPLVDGLLAL